MRSLVAEANVVTRVTLRRLLERAGFSVEELRDELAAACLLYQPDPPDLALLALDTLLVDFAQVCDAMRTAKPEVFIVALVPESRRHELSAVLDAGADDFLIKPAILQEAEARLHIIRRTLTLVGGSPYVAADQREGLQATAHATSRKQPLSQILAGLDLPQAFKAVFGQMGLAPIQEFDAAEALTRPAYTGWAPLLLRREEQAQWVNIRIDLDEPHAAGLFRRVYPRTPYAEGVLLHLLREIMGLALDSIRSSLEGYEQVEVYMPVPPVALRAEQVPSPGSLASSHARQRALGLSLVDQLRLHVAVTTEPLSCEERTITHLRRFDVLAAPIASTEYQTMLLRAGTMLSDTYINKIQVFVHSQNLSQTVQVFHPPAGSAAFLSDLDVV